MSASIESPPELRVLMVHDDPREATSLSCLLQLVGCKTAVAVGAAMGLRVLQLFKPSLVIVQLRGSADAGRGFPAAVRAVALSPLPMFVCLATSAADEERCLAAGYDRFCSMPMEPASLTEFLAAARVQTRVAAPTP